MPNAPKQKLSRPWEKVSVVGAAKAIGEVNASGGVSGQDVVNACIDVI